MNVLLLVIAPNTFFIIHIGECSNDGWFLNQGIGKCSTNMYLDWTSCVIQGGKNKLKSSSIMSTVDHSFAKSLLKWEYDGVRKPSVLIVENNFDRGSCHNQFGLGH
jgi:hypothetical protein